MRMGVRPGGMALSSVAVAIPLWVDGPDPDVDPVGYALSQILPLGRVHTSDHTVSTALHALIGADRTLIKSKGSDRAATSGIKKADASLHKACPGVAA